MPKDNQYTSAWLFLGILSMPLLFIVLLQVLQLSVRHQLEERLEREAAVSLVLPAGALVWAEPDRELLVDGQLFDIKTIRYEGGKALVTGIFDYEETNISRLLSERGAASERSDSLAQLLDWLQQFVSTGAGLCFVFAGENASAFAFYSLARYASPVLALIAPPPQP